MTKERVLASLRVSRRRFIGTSITTGLAGIVPWGATPRETGTLGIDVGARTLTLRVTGNSSDGYGVTVLCGGNPVARHNGGGEFFAVFQNQERSLEGRTENWRASAWTGDEAHITLHGECKLPSSTIASLPRTFFGVYYISQGANAGVNAGMIKQTNWGFQALQSFRAPAGTLDKRVPTFCVIAKSMYVNPKWVRLSKAINDKMLADFNQKLKEGYDQLRAAQAVVAQTMKQQAAFQANFDKQEESFRSSGGVDDSYLRDGGARSAADHWDDMIRGVDTLNDPNGGTTQLSNLGQYHFTDGFGNYRTTDDPNYTREKAGEVGTWTQMTTAQ
jgi:hypothetical protein